LVELGVEENECVSPMIFQYHNQFFTWANTEDVAVVNNFLPSGKMVIKESMWADKLQHFILPLSKNYAVNFGNLEKEEIKDVLPDCKLLLKEKGDYLVLEPIFSYKGYEIGNSDKEKIIMPFADKLLVIQRNMGAERAFMSRLENLHSNFVKPENTNTLALKGADVLKDNWFFLFIDAVKEMSITIYGFDALKHFRFNTAKPSTKIFISSNTDWFDAKVEISFGTQKVTVDDIKKALTSKQQFVQLQDGSLGILPDEWVKKYSLLFRVGEGKTNSIKLSKYHFSVIEELYNERNEEELFFQLEEKYDNLK
jgi:non-specific serine/threonine protein kinase